MCSSPDPIETRDWHKENMVDINSGKQKCAERKVKYREIDTTVKGYVAMLANFRCWHMKRQNCIMRCGSIWLEEPLPNNIKN